jgi:hypothetical protein
MMLLIFSTERTCDIGRTTWDLRHLRHGTYDTCDMGLATWTCDTCVMRSVDILRCHIAKT